MSDFLHEPVKLSKLDPAATKGLRLRVDWTLLPDLKTPPEGDAFLFLLDKNDKAPQNEDFVFYNQLDGVEGTVVLSVDDTHQQHEGGRHTFDVKLDALRYEIVRIVLGFALYRGGERDQTLRFVDRLAVVIEAHGKELARTEIDPKTHRDGVAIELLELHREGSDWQIGPMNAPVAGLEDIARRYGIVVAGAV